jgi:hypothetical protein
VIKSVFALACACACSALAITLSPDDEAARDVALQWLHVADAGNYKDAALLIADYAGGSQNWMKYFAAHRAPLGRVNNRKIAEVKHASTVTGDPEVRQHAIIRFKTSFEHPPSVRAGLAPNSGVASKTVAIEEVVVTKMGCCWEVSGYTISDR